MGRFFVSLTGALSVGGGAGGIAGGGAQGAFVVQQQASLSPLSYGNVRRPPGLTSPSRLVGPSGAGGSASYNGGGGSSPSAALSRSGQNWLMVPWKN